MGLGEKYIDLHIHSRVSDGTWSPEEIASMAKKSGVDIFSITDHDNLGAVLEGEKCAKEKGLNYIYGVELSSTFYGATEHILAYGIQRENENLIALLSENLNKQLEEDNSSIQYLLKSGYHVDFGEFLKYENNNKRGGFKLLNYLIDKGICRDVEDFFFKFSKEAQLTQNPQYRSPEEVVKIIKQAGGIPILAHPYYSSKTTENPKTRLSRFVECGIEGFECFHPNHSIATTEECLDYCRRNNLIITAGSDCHGTLIPQRKIGMHSVKIEDINIGNLKNFIL